MENYSIELSDEKVCLLMEKWGYELQKEKKTFYRNAYHNQVEEFEAHIIRVFKDGKPVPDLYGDGPGEYLFLDFGRDTKMQQVKKIFREELSNRLFVLLDFKI